MAKAIKKALVDIKKKSIEEEENVLMDSGHYIDTKYYPLNLILNGSLFKGLPLGQVLMFGGKPQTGKSYVAELLAHKVHDDYDSKIDWYDIENAFGNGTQTDLDVKEKGFDPDKFNLVKLPEEYEMWTVENFGVQMSKRLDDILDERTNKKNENYNPNRINMIVLDSLNSLPINKEAKDVKKEDAGQDMGQKSKIIQRVFKPLIQKAYKTKTIIIIINQVYEVPSLFPGQLPKFSGGNFTQFMASRMILFMTYDIKNEDKEQRNRKYGSNKLCLLAFKNRSIVKGTFVNCVLSYDKGLHRFSDICSLIPKIYEPLTDKNTQYRFHEWKLYDESEQKRKLQNQLEKKELDEMFDFEKFKQLESYKVDDSNYNYYVVSNENEEEIVTKAGKKLILVDSSQDPIDIAFMKSNPKYKKIASSDKFNIIRFVDELCIKFSQIEKIHTYDFKDSSYCDEDSFQLLKYDYFKIKSTKSKVKLHKNLKFINTPANKTEETAVKLEDCDKEFITSDVFIKATEEKEDVVVRFCSYDMTAKQIYKKNGTEHFTMALLEKLEPHFNEMLYYKNDTSDFELDDEVDFLEEFDI